MNDLQTKFAMSFIMFSLFLSYVVPTMKQAKQTHDNVNQMVATFYVAPNPDDPRAPHGNVTLDQILKYRDQKAAERNALALR
jgi:hypothetical protein